MRRTVLLAFVAEGLSHHEAGRRFGADRRMAWIRSDNGPEFVAKAVRQWIAAVGARLRSAGHPAWPRNQLCTNIPTGPVDGGRSAAGSVAATGPGTVAPTGPWGAGSSGVQTECHSPRAGRVASEGLTARTRSCCCLKSWRRNSMLRLAEARFRVQ